jgi:hypothetical protein
VILNLSYTAEEDDTLRQEVESRNAAVQGGLLGYLRYNTMLRVFSPRQEFSTAFNWLVNAPAGTPVTFEITDRHFPLFLHGRGLAVAGTRLVLGVGDRSAAVSSVSLSVDGTAVTGLPGRPAIPGGAIRRVARSARRRWVRGALKSRHTVIATNAGGLAPEGGDGSPLFDERKLRNILLVVEYRLALA